MTDVPFDRESGAYSPSTGRPAFGETGEAGVPVLTQYIRIAIRWRWLILGAIGLALLLGVILTLLATPRYTAITRIEISRESARIVEVASVQPENPLGDQEFYQTQYGLLRSQSLAERVARELRLAENSEFYSMFGKSEEYERLSGGAARLSASARDELIRLASNILLDNVAVSPMRLSRLVDIGFTSPNPALSARVANAWATGFIRSNLERRFEATSYARTFLEQRLAQLRERLEASERQLVSYASREAIINIPVSAGTGETRTVERSLTAESLAALNTELARATGERIQAQSRLRGAGGTSVEALTNQAITNMRSRRAEAAAEYSRLITQFQPDYPPARALAAQIQQLDASIAGEEGRVRSSLQRNYRDSLSREQTLSANVESLKQAFLDQRRRSIQYNIFQREVDTNRQLYDGLLQRYKEIGVAGGVGTNNVSIVDQARVPNRPSHPRPFINLLLALIGGAVAGVGLALAREHIDETVADPGDLERRIGIPLLGVIPASDSADLLDELKDPKSILIESYLSVQTNLEFSTDHGTPRSIAITSTRPAEGKSVTAFAIAYTMARNGSRTLLIDGDMRSPSVHVEVGIDNSRGLSNYLSGTSDLAALIRQLDNEPFSVLPAGPQPPNAAELLRSDRFESLLTELSGRFDHVVIDSPPVMGLADAPIIGSRTEAVVFVLEARGVTARIARLALARLRQGRAQLLGAVLTKFEAKRSNYGYGYGYDYGYGYGHGRKESED